MSTFGIVFFLLIGGMAFWMLLFLMGFILPYWITLGLFEQLRPKRVLDEEDKQKNKQQN
tara:strand:+ start:3252 stop:3428 length:177 start_codon:yes stop_codon:yes gene_type:complete